MNNWQLRKESGLNRTLEFWSSGILEFVSKVSEFQNSSSVNGFLESYKLRNPWTSVKFVGKKKKPQISLIGTEDIWEELWASSFFRNWETEKLKTWEVLWALNFELWAFWDFCSLLMARCSYPFSDFQVFRFSVFI